MGESAPEPTPPAAPLPPSRRARVAWYVGTVLVTCVVLFAGLRLDKASLRAPLYYDADALLILPMVKATLERGSHWRNERMGAPGIQELHDFPVIDHLHFALIWLLGKAVPDAVIVFNLYYLAGYPLVALTGMIALRHLRLSLPAAACGGLLYAFLPYHYLRGESHYFLSAYWMVPLSLLPYFRLCRGELPFFRPDVFNEPRLTLKTRASLGLVALCAATASAGAYYAFFACAFYAAAGVFAWVIYRTWRSAASAAVLCGVVMAFGLLNHAPTIAYQFQNGRNPVTNRGPEEADVFGMKIAHLVLPVTDHNLATLSRLKAAWTVSRDRPLENENDNATLGLVGTVGFFTLLGVLLFRGPRVQPLGPLAATTAFLLLFSTIGGLGSVFNLLVFDQIRCYNRVSVFLAFVYLFVALRWLDLWLASRTGALKGRLALVFVGVAAVGLADQTPFAWFRPPVVKSTAAQQARFGADARFFARIEERMPPGAKVFQLPMMPFPEYPPIHDMQNYDPACGYIHTRTLCWSFGAMKGREADIWNRSVARHLALPTPQPHEFLRRVVVRGFDGILVDKRGYFTDKKRNSGPGQKVAELLRAAAAIKPGLHLPFEEHEDGWQTFLDIRPYRDALIEQSRDQFEAWAREERELMTMVWLRGFNSYEAIGAENGLHFGNTRASAVLVNPTDRTRKVRLRMMLGVDRPGVFDLRFESSLRQDDGSPFAEHIPDLQKPGGEWRPEVRNFGPQREYVVVVPPGRHPISFRCKPPPLFMPPYQLTFYVLNFTMDEVK